MAVVVEDNVNIPLQRHGSLSQRTTARVIFYFHYMFCSVGKREFPH